MHLCTMLMTLANEAPVKAFTPGFFCAKLIKLRVLTKLWGFWNWWFLDQDLIVYVKIRNIIAKMGGESSENSGSESRKLRVRKFSEFGQTTSQLAIHKKKIKKPAYVVYLVRISRMHVGESSHRQHSWLHFRRGKLSWRCRGCNLCKNVPCTLA